MKTSVKINENKKLQKNCHLSILFLTPKNFFFLSKQLGMYGHIEKLLYNSFDHFPYYLKFYK